MGLFDQETLPKGVTETPYLHWILSTTSGLPITFDVILERKRS